MAKNKYETGGSTKPYFKLVKTPEFGSTSSSIKKASIEAIKKATMKKGGSVKKKK